MPKTILKHRRSARNAVSILLASVAIASFTDYLSSKSQAATTKPLGDKPNILFVLTDDQTMDSLSTSMPYLASKPKGSWATFDNAFLSNPLCCPSRATILSGQYSRHTGVTDNITTSAHFDDQDTIATWLHSSGYKTGLFGKYLNEYPWDRGDSYVPPGWDDWFGFLKAGYIGYNVNDNGTVEDYGRKDEDYSTNVTAARVNDFIASSGKQPFFAYWAPHAPHAVTLPEQKYRNIPEPKVVHSPNFNETDVSDKPAWIQNLPVMDKATVHDMDTQRQNQWRTLRSVDDGIKELMNTLQTTHKLDNTVIVFMTDNGLSLGDHRWDHKQCEYDECTRTPMMIRYPGIKDKTVRDLVSNIDMSPTLTDITGAVPTIPEDGRSLVPLLAGRPTTWRGSLLFEWNGGFDNENPAHDPVYVPGWQAVRTESYKYVQLSTGEKELYDLKIDPYELSNVVNQPDYVKIQAGLSARLAAWIN